MQHDPHALRTLVFIPFGSNVGYAIAPLESLFFDVALELAGGDAGRVHFAFRSLERGNPASLPQDFANVVALDPFEPTKENLDAVERYATQHRIDHALFFDLQPIHPVLSRLRHAGVRTLTSYWGAPISSYMSYWKLTLKRLQIALARTRLDGLIFESRAMANAAVYGRGVSPSAIDVVPLGIDTQLFRPGPSDYAHRVLDIPSDRKLVFYAGHMEARKGVRVLVDAAVALLAEQGREDVCFVIFGDRPGEAARFEPAYRGKGIERWIRFGGYRNDLPRILACCYCGVIPSTGWDSFPRTSLEIQASGIPIVASRLDGIPEGIVERETGLLFEPGDVSALARMLTELLDDPVLAREMGTKARAHIVTNFSLAAQRRGLRDALAKRCEPTQSRQVRS